MANEICTDHSFMKWISSSTMRGVKAVEAVQEEKLTLHWQLHFLCSTTLTILIEFIGNVKALLFGTSSIVYCLIEKEN